MDNKFFLIVIFVFIFLIVCLFISRPAEKWGTACFKENCFDVRLARDDAERARGLMFQIYLGQNKGMLFLFDQEARYSFWMKNTFIPLDMIWLGRDNKIVFISENNRPCRWDSCPLIEPPAEAKYVLELNGGAVRKIGLKLGDEMALDY